MPQKPPRLVSKLTICFVSHLLLMIIQKFCKCHFKKFTFSFQFYGVPPSLYPYHDLEVDLFEMLCHSLNVYNFIKDAYKTYAKFMTVHIFENSNGYSKLEFLYAKLLICQLVTYIMMKNVKDCVDLDYEDIACVC
jgi:hypothetical protein